MAQPRHKASAAKSGDGSSAKARNQIDTVPTKKSIPTSKLPIRTSFFIAGFIVLVTTQTLKYLNGPLAPCDEIFPQVYSADYDDAKAKFIASAKTAGATLHSIPIDTRDGPKDLSIDVAVIPGTKEDMVVYLSGTHGVEGFAGSAIQALLLQRIASAEFTLPSNHPTIVFVHSVNPYGFWKLRRVNENNVDLNRNFIAPEDFDRLSKRDTSIYEDIYDAINPTEVPTLTNPLPALKIGFALLKSLATNGWTKVNAAIIEVQYKFPEGLSYGGKRVQQSIQELRHFLETNFDLSEIRRVAIVDVHTGLGPVGKDTLLVKGDSNMPELANKFFVHGERNLRLGTVEGPTGEDPTGMSKAYKNRKGDIALGIRGLFRNAANAIALTQEFGTLPSVLVFYRLLRENAATHNLPETERAVYGDYLKSAFFHDTCFWKGQILNRGEIVFDQIIQKFHNVLT